MKYQGISYQKRVMEVNEIYDKHIRSGLSNREIWKRYIHPVYGISEKTFYNYLKATSTERLMKKVGAYLRENGLLKDKKK